MAENYDKCLNDSESQETCTLSGKGEFSRTRDRVQQGRLVTTQERLLKRYVPMLKYGGPKKISPRPYTMNTSRNDRMLTQ